MLIAYFREGNEVVDLITAGLERHGVRCDDLSTGLLKARLTPDKKIINTRDHKSNPFNRLAFVAGGVWTATLFEVSGLRRDSLAINDIGHVFN